MGGRIAWRFAAAEPVRVSKLVLMAPDGVASLGREHGRALELLPWLMRLLFYTAPKLLLRRTMRNAYAVLGVLTDAVVDRYHAVLLAPGVRVPSSIMRCRRASFRPSRSLRRSAHRCCCYVTGETARSLPLTPPTTNTPCPMRAG
jgi:pimeloyl-ACP methyl ester carboxylesterase